MTFALVEINPFSVIQTYLGNLVPDPLVWPDGAVTHATTVGFVRGNWMLASVAYTPPQPGEFYLLQSSTASFAGSVVTYTQTWAPNNLASVQSTLTQRINQAAEGERLRYITPGVGQSMIYLQKLAQAQALQTWIAANPTGAPNPATYPLLAASVGIEENAAGTGPCSSLSDVMTLVLSVYGQWMTIGAQIETLRLKGLSAVAAATTVDLAVSAWEATVFTSLQTAPTAVP